MYHHHHHCAVFFLGGWDLDQGTLGSVARLPVKLPYEFRVRRGEASGFEV